MTTQQPTPVKAGARWSAKYHPTPGQLEVLVTWAAHGPGALDPEADRLGGSRGDVNRPRVMNLLRLRELIVRLELPSRYETMRHEVLRGAPVSGLDPRLLDELCRRARLLGRITTGAGGVVPLTALQAYVLDRVAWGACMRSLSSEMGLSGVAVRETMHRIRVMHGCATTNQLIGCAYRNGWLPDHTEFRALHKAMVWPSGAPAYLTGRTA